jgi:hypothetical protein
VDIIEELGQLTELRVLQILFSEWNGKLVERLRKLQKIQFLKVNSFRRNISGLPLDVSMDWIYGAAAGSQHFHIG